MGEGHGQLTAAAVHGIGLRACRQQVAAHRGKLGPRQQAVVVQQREHVTLDRVGVGDAGIRHGRHGDPGQELAQERGFHVGGDAHALGHALAQVGLDVAVRHNHLRRDPRAQPLALGRKVFHKGIEKQLGAMGCVDAQHARRITRAADTGFGELPPTPPSKT